MSTANQTVITGVGMTKFGKALERSLKDLAGEAISKAIADAGLAKEDLGCVFASNSVAGVMTGQEAVRGQVSLKSSGIGGIPLFNIENACASGSSAFHLADVYVRGGMADVALVVGFEKMVHPDKAVSFKALETCTDVEELAALQRRLGAADKGRSIFMDLYAEKVRAYLKKSEATPNHLAAIAAKNHCNGANNTHAQYQKRHDVESVLGSRTIVEPLTLLMCSPLSDGAAAIVLVSSDWAKSHGVDGPKVAATGITSDSLESEGSQVAALARRVYERAGINGADVDLAEVHDATAAGELFAYEDLDLAPRGEGWRLIDEGDVFIGGRVPVNPSGGLIARGHPIGATGIAQLCELTWQLRGEAGVRQVQGVEVAVAHNRGGRVANEMTSGSAAMSIIVLKG
ncbi:MAG: thiolase family protein [Gammaproteobacteria bacterium]|nr:thiolase family protein [Gammaproteobacteria bacterium]